VKLPTGFCKWVFVGAPLTPNGLNNGMANFPEFHNVYVEQKNIDAFLMTGSFPEGTVFVKELTRVLTPMFQDGPDKLVPVPRARTSASSPASIAAFARS
jgi:hypothetical protein